MTGYGRAQAALGAGHVIVEVRSVNHRYLDVRVRFPPDLSSCVVGAEALARKTLQRGRADVTARIVGAVGGDMKLDGARARAIYRQLETLRDELAPEQPVPLAMLANVPELFVRSEPTDEAAARTAVEAATANAIGALTDMRRREGAALRRDLHERVASVRALAQSIAPHAGEVVSDYREKLHKRIEALLSGSGVALDAARLEHEVAAFADRADVAEELTRLESHCEQFGALIMTDSAAIGRKLDFLLQEMGREANTIGSKVAAVDVTNAVVSLKAELERMREQAQNVL